MNEKDLILNVVKSHIIFITGGTKSGKSEFAEHLAKGTKNLTYVALSENNIEDKDWQNKIYLHRKRRPKDWELIETNDILNTLTQEKTVINYEKSQPSSIDNPVVDPNFNTMRSKDTESSTATYIVIGLLIAATIIPLATWWYFSK